VDRKRQTRQAAGCFFQASAGCTVGGLLDCLGLWWRSRAHYIGPREKEDLSLRLFFGQRNTVERSSLTCDTIPLDQSRNYITINHILSRKNNPLTAWCAQKGALVPHKPLRLVNWAARAD
jgi:hypothetical protein